MEIIECAEEASFEEKLDASNDECSTTYDHNFATKRCPRKGSHSWFLRPWESWPQTSRERVCQRLLEVQMPLHKLHFRIFYRWIGQQKQDHPATVAVSSTGSVEELKWRRLLPPSNASFIKLLLLFQWCKSRIERQKQEWSSKQNRKVSETIEKVTFPTMKITRKFTRWNTRLLWFYCSREENVPQFASLLHHQEELRMNEKKFWITQLIKWKEIH